MVRDGYPFIGVLLGLAIPVGIIGWWHVVVVLLLLAVFVGYFFRDPERQIPSDSSLVVSPADGKIVEIQESKDDKVGSCHQVSIFLSILDVHINRLPLGGIISEIQYKRGKFLAAFNSRSSVENEQNSVWIRSNEGDIRITQIAGLIARRIVCWKKQGDAVDRGERFGLIRFGSRVDIFLPRNYSLLVKIGDRVKGGLTIVARPPSQKKDADRIHCE